MILFVWFICRISQIKMCFINIMSFSVSAMLGAVWGLLLWCLISEHLSSTVLRARHCAGSFAVHEEMNHINPSPHAFLREIKHVHKSFNKNAEVTASMGTEKNVVIKVGKRERIILAREGYGVLFNRSIWRGRVVLVPCGVKKQRKKDVTLPTKERGRGRKK